MSAKNLHVKPVGATTVLKAQVYEALKSAILSLDLYADDTETKLDERRLADELGVSRTPIREALTLLEMEGLVKMIPRRGAFVVRKAKREILEMIRVWGALEGLAARLATTAASDEEIAGLRKEFAPRDDPDRARAEIDEYAEDNIRFHRSIIRMSKCELLSEITEGLFIHLRAIRSRSFAGRGASPDSVVGHSDMIEALEKRDAELAEKLVREHTSRLYERVKILVNGAD